MNRATHLVSQLLTLARIQGDLHQAKRGAVSLPKVVTQVVADRQGAAQAESLALAAVLPADDPCVVAARRAVLEILVGNLVDNALKFIPPGAR